MSLSNELPIISTEDIYLDHAATTPVDSSVVAAMMPFFTQRFGNPSSIYRSGQEARAALDQARSEIAQVLNCDAAEIIFTSGATESNNLALNGIVQAVFDQGSSGTRPHVITTAIEHHAVLHPAERLRKAGVDLTVVPSDSQGLIDPDTIIKAITPATRLVSVMYGNNETGAVQPVLEIAEAVREREIPFHTDAVQAAGAFSLNVQELGVDLLSLTAHKFYGPKGVGLLYVRRGTQIAPIQLGGGQESGRRAGTENLPLIFGQARSLSIANLHREALNRHAAEIRDALWQGIQDSIEDVHLNGPPLGPQRLPNNLNVAFTGVQGETMLLALDMEGVSVSAGSACTTGNTQPSHVLLAMGLSPDRSRSSLRMTTGRTNTIDQVEDVVGSIEGAVSRVRQLSRV